MTKSTTNYPIPAPCSPSVNSNLTSSRVSPITTSLTHSSMAPWIEEFQLPAHFNIPVTLDNFTTVKPAGPIPASSGDCLYLSNIDDVIGSRVFTPTIYFYASNSLNSERKSVGKILHESLASILVPYYPFSGRIREASNGKLEIYFGPNQGALMVEAHSDMTISDLGELTVPNPAWAPLIYRDPNEKPYQVVNMPLVIAQVTTFSCGGFSLGLRICHCLCDGLGAMQFISAWATTARTGRVVTSPEPCWDREFFRPREPAMIEFPHTEYMSIEDSSTLTSSLQEAKPVQKCYKVSREFQTRLKQLAQPEAEDGVTCTTFDAMAAHVWRSWVKALQVTPLDYELRLTFSVNGREKLRNPPLKEGFYGNVVCVACVTRTVSQLIERPFKETTRLVREARVSISEEYVRSMVDYIEVNRPRRLEFGGKLTITQWTRFSMYESADFGWGQPVYAGPIDLTPTPQLCVLLPEGGQTCSLDMVVICICLPISACEKFNDYIQQIDGKHQDH